VVSRGGCKPGVAIFEVVFRIRLDFNGFQKRGSKEVAKLFTNVRFKSYQKIKPFFKNFQKKIRTGVAYLDAVKGETKKPRSIRTGA
jgi:hypothetical protein